MILVDTSIWIDHINKGGLAHLDYLLAGESVLTHPLVIGEIAMGSLKNRKAQLALQGDLHQITAASDLEVMTLVETAKLHGSGLSYIDAHLLAAVTLDGLARLWTRDKRLRTLVNSLELMYEKD